VRKTFSNNIIKLTILGDDDVEKININKLRIYHYKNVAADIMVANVHVERYPSRYHPGRTSIIISKNLSRLVPKPRRLPWTNSIPKIIDDEYFWTKKERSRSSERKARSSGYKATLFFLNHYILPTMP
jgi:hypothetical protein